MDKITKSLKPQLISVDENREGQRVDNFILAKLPKIPKTLVYRWIRKGEVRVNKKRVKPTYKLCFEDIVRIPPVKVEVRDQFSKLTKDKLDYLEKTVLYENDNFMIINKPSGLAVHGGTGIDSGLIERLRILRPQEKNLELVHRLDRDTSGCIIIAKKYSALKYFHELLRERKIKKTYHALVAGNWPKSLHKIDKPLKKITVKSGERFVRVDKEGKQSLTTVSILKKYPSVTLLEVFPHTGRTHQIRVHLQSCGYPILGDSKYANKEIEREFAKLDISRLFLHAYQLSFIPPEVKDKLKKSANKMIITANYDKMLMQTLENVNGATKGI